MTTGNEFMAPPDVLTAGLNQGENLSHNQDLQLLQMVRSKRLKSEKCELSGKVFLNCFTGDIVSM